MKIFSIHVWWDYHEARTAGDSYEQLHALGFPNAHEYVDYGPSEYRFIAAENREELTKAMHTVFDNTIYQWTISPNEVKSSTTNSWGQTAYSLIRKATTEGPI